MSRVNLTIDLPDEIEQEARKSGLLEVDKLSYMIQSEVKRQMKRRGAGQRLSKLMDEISTDFRADYGHLTDKEAMEMIAQWGDEALEQAKDKKDASTP